MRDEPPLQQTSGPRTSRHVLAPPLASGVDAADTRMKDLRTEAIRADPEVDVALTLQGDRWACEG